MLSNLNSALPPETWGRVLSFLPARDLCSTSLVSQDWRFLSFPYLYHTVCASSKSNLRRISEGGTSKDGQTLPVIQHLRGLVLEPSKQGSDLTESDVSLLNNILQRVPSLEYFAWKLEFLPLDMMFMQLLRTHCPNLRTLESHSYHLWGARLNNQVTAVEFHNLHHIFLRISPPEHGFHNSYAKPLASSLRACPNLQTFELYIDKPWSLKMLIIHLQNFTFPFLHTLRALGDHEEDWDEFSHPGNGISLYDFFVRHCRLQTISLGSFGVDNPPDPSEIIDAAFPSLAHFQAPVSSCSVVLLSQRSAQILSLHVTHLGKRSAFLIYDLLPRMPMLRKLVLEDDLPDTSECLTEVVNCRSETLEELEIGADPVDDIFESLQFLPNLRVLSIQPRFPSSLKLKSGHEGWPECVRAFAEVCPKLRFVYDRCNWRSRDYWSITRGLDGTIKVVGM